MIYHITYKLNFYFYRKYDVIYTVTQNVIITREQQMERNYLCIPTFQLNLFTRDSSTIRAHLRKFTYLRRFVSGIDRKEPRLATQFVRAWTLFSREKTSLGLVVFCAYLCNGRVVLTTVSRFSNEGYRCEVIEKRRMRIEKNCFRFSTLLHYFVTSEQ